MTTLPKATARAIEAIDNVTTALIDAGYVDNPRGMTDDGIARIVDAAYTARTALDEAGGPIKNAADKLRSA